jgi:hypothetical protein
MHAEPRSRKVRRFFAFAAAAAAGACVLHASPGEARADVSSWFTGGGGYGVQHSDSRGVYDRATALSFSIGVGTQPTRSIVVGGLLRTTTYFTLGTDLGLSARIASGSFARGQWGLAFDFGPGWRSWGRGADYGRFPLHAMVVGGAPWGLQLGVGGDIWSIGGALRLTVMRQGATDRWWENPSPAGGRAAAPSAAGEHDAHP